MVYALDLNLSEANWRKSVSSWTGDQAIDVKAAPHNAKGDGGTDDTAAFVSAAAAAVSGGRSLHVPSGTFKISQKVTLAGLTIAGMGPSSIIKPASASFNALKLSGSGGRVHNLAFHGAAVDNSTTQFGIEADTTPPDDVEISGCYFGGTTGESLNNGIFFPNGGTNLRVHNNHFENLIGIVSGTGYGVLMVGCTQAIVALNTFKGIRGTHGRHAIYFSAGTSHSIAIANTVDSFSTEAISVYAVDPQPYCENISIIGNTLTSCGTDYVSNGSIWIGVKVKNITAAHNQIYNSFGCGIMCDAGNVSLSGAVTLDGNRIIDPYYYGIWVFGFPDQMVRNNHVYGASRKTANSYADIRVGSDGTTQPDVIQLLGNFCRPVAGGAVSQTAINVSVLAPLPLKVIATGNSFPASTDYSLVYPQWNNDLIPVLIEGRYQTNKTVNFASTAGGAVTATGTVSVIGARVGNTVKCQHDQAGAYWQSFGVVTADDLVTYWGQNQDTVAADPANGTLWVDVWPRVS